MIYQKTCEHCGKRFTAQKSSTRYCSKYCADNAYKEKLRKATQLAFKNQEEAAARNNFQRRHEVLSPELLAEYLEVSIRTVYRYLESNLIPCLRLRGRTLVRRSDVDAIFDAAPPYQKRPAAPRMEKKDEIPDSIKGGDSTEDSRYTTAKEVAERHDLSLSGAHKILNESGITQIKHQGKLFYHTSEVEALFRRREKSSHPEIKEWYSCAEIQEKYGLKPTAIYEIVATYRIPSKKIHKLAYYSKIHFDAVRGGKIMVGTAAQSTDSEWYSVQEAMEEYSQTRDQVYGVLRQNNIERVQMSRYVKFRRRDYDDAMKYRIK
jgi:Bacteriophage Lambda NinG protein.